MEGTRIGRGAYPSLWGPDGHRDAISFVFDLVISQPRERLIHRVAHRASSASLRRPTVGVLH